MTGNQIKSVAMSLFARHGYEGTSLNDIAREVGIKKPSIYNHFKGKEDLFMAIWDEVLHTETQYIRKTVEINEQETVYNKLYNIFKYSCERYELNNEILFWKRAVFFPPEFLKSKIQTKFISFENIVSEILTTIFNEGIASGIIRPREISCLLAAYYCLLDGLFIECHYYDHEGYITRVDAVWGIFWDGIKM